MTTVSRPNKDALTRALDILRDAMRPFIVRNLRRIPGGRPDDRIRHSLERWTPDDYRTNTARGHVDAESLLDINNFPILIRDYWRDAFRDAVSNDMTVQNALWQIKEARNQASHPSTQDIDPEFARAHLFHVIDVLGKIGRPNERAEVERIRDSLFATPTRPMSLPRCDGATTRFRAAGRAAPTSAPLLHYSGAMAGSGTNKSGRGAGRL